MASVLFSLDYTISLCFLIPDLLLKIKLDKITCQIRQKIPPESTDMILSSDDFNSYLC